MRKAGRNSLVGGVLALSLVLAGTGYAYWTDSLNVTTKATTGDFGVQFVDLGLYAQYGNETVQGGWSIVDGVGESGYVADNFFMRGKGTQSGTDDTRNQIAKDGSIEAYKDNVKGYNNIAFNAELVDKTKIAKQVGSYNPAYTDASGKILLTIDKMYPGYAQAFRTDVVNVGDIAAQLSNIKFEAKDLDGKELGNLKEMIGVAVYIDREQYRPDQKVDEPVFELAKFMNSDKTFRVGGVDFIRLSALNDKDVKEALKNNVIKCAPATDQRLDMFVAVAMDPDAQGVYTTGTSENRKDNNDKDSQSKGVEVSMDLLWDQFNVGKDAGTPNILVNQNK